VQQHPLAALADLQHAAHLLAAQALDIAQRDDLPLAVRQVIDGRPEPPGQLRRVQPAVGLLDPALRRGRPVSSNRDGSTAGSGSPTGTLRRSRAPVVLARFTRIRSSQVRNEERPSNPPSPRSTPSHVSWTTSSATATLGT